MKTSPLMPSNASLGFWISVLCCFVFWLAAYGLIIRRGFRDKTFGMPIAALCGNIAWETLFSNVYIPDYLLVRIGNSLWILFDMAILVTALKYGPKDFAQPVIKNYLRPLIFVGIGVAVCVSVPFVNAYKDTQGYFLGWAAALIMSVLFIAMLLRRGNLHGQSLYIALSMFLGNIAAYLWVKFYPREVLDPKVNLSFMLATGLFNIIYIVLVWQKSRELGLKPLARF